MQVPGELSEPWSSDVGEGELESLSCRVDLLVFLLNHSEMLQTSIQEKSSLDGKVFYYFFNLFLFIDVWLYQVFVAFSHGFSLVAM